MLNYGPLTPDGTIQKENLPPPGPMSTDTMDGVGLGDDADTPGLRMDFRSEVPHLTFSTQSSSWDGSGTLNGNFGDVNPGPVDSELDLAVHKFITTWDMVPGSLVEFGLGLGVIVADTEASFVNTNDQSSDGFDEVVSLPVVSTRLGARFWWIDTELLLSWMDLTMNDDTAEMLDIDLNAKIALIGSHGLISGSVVVGWRSLAIDAEYDDDDEHEVVDDLSFDGWYVGLQFGI